MTPTPKIARWIFGASSIKLMSPTGRQIAYVSPPYGPLKSWYYTAGRSLGGTVADRAEGIRRCEVWARSRGYTISDEVPYAA